MSAKKKQNEPRDEATPIAGAISDIRENVVIQFAVDRGEVICTHRWRTPIYARAGFMIAQEKLRRELQSLSKFIELVDRLGWDILVSKE